jgi:hypothetical protein
MQKTISQKKYLKEMNRTVPDYVAYAPPFDEKYECFGNEEFHVIELGNRELLAIWTQSHHEGSHTQRGVFAHSYNGGITWSEPKRLVDSTIDKDTGKGMVSWAIPVRSKSGKIYVLFNKHTGRTFHTSHQHGTMNVIASEDNGHTWTEEGELDLPRSKWDHPDLEIPSNWVMWQMPQRLSNGTVLGALTRWFCHNEEANDCWWLEHESGIEFFRFDNIDDDPAPKDLTLSFFAQNDDIVTAPHFKDPARRVAQEPCMVELPDMRLFCVMRTREGHIWYTLSGDFGETWSETKMLRFYDGGPGIEHPLSPSPIYALNDRGEFVLFYHNHDGHFGPVEEKSCYRCPVFASKGVFVKDKEQPIQFSVPMLMFDTNGHSVGAINVEGLALYGSMTYEEDGTPVLWYPDRKHFLLGKRLDLEELDSLKMME